MIEPGVQRYFFIARKRTGKFHFLALYFVFLESLSAFIGLFTGETLVANFALFHILLVFPLRQFHESLSAVRATFLILKPFGNAFAATLLLALFALDERAKEIMLQAYSAIEGV